MNIFKKLIKKLFIQRIRNLLSIDEINDSCSEIKDYIRWVEMDRPAPPPNFIKQMTVKEYAKKYKLKLFIETGTYLGDMINEVKGNFEKVYSIELGEDLYNRAKEKFEGENNISLLQGDSTDVLPKILGQIDNPCLFWLDAHYSEGVTSKGVLMTPILQELNHIINHSVKKHVILIDDAREFTGKNDYPTLIELKNFILKHNEKYEFEVKNDIIRIYLKQVDSD